jgi:DNA-binding response OmpR family regulator
VLFNLLSNGVKFTPAAGRVTVAAAVDGEELIVSVADTGVGIAAGDRDKVFEEFGRASSVTAKEGTGLGMPLSKKFVELHGGRIWFDSEPEAGSTFFFAVPVQRSAIAPASPQDTTRGPRVLVIEDDPNAVELLTIYLEGAGFDVATAPDGEAGLVAARALHPDVIVLDVILPRLDGWDVLAVLKADPQLADIPVVVLSMLDDRDKGFALGAAEYLVKPVQRAEVIATLERLARPEQVLVIDDDPIALELVSSVLAAEGIAVETARGGAEGIAAATARHHDLVILDLVMPDVDGFAVLDALRASPQTATVPVLVLTSKSLSAAEKKYLNDQMAALAAKAEFDRAAFVELVHNCCPVRT